MKSKSKKHAVPKVGQKDKEFEALLRRAAKVVSSQRKQKTSDRPAR